MNKSMFMCSVNFGSIADWCMVFVTIITAYFLYRTLKSQIKVQNTQINLLEIERIRFNESIKPDLRFRVSNLEFSASEGNKKILTIEVWNESDASALNIHLTSKEMMDSKQIFIPLDLPRNDLKKDSKPLLYHFLLDNQADGHFLVFGITFENVAHVKYKQGVVYAGDNNNHEFNISIPEEIS